jgi:hypothetical protein
VLRAKKSSRGTRKKPRGKKCILGIAADETVWDAGTIAAAQAADKIARYGQLVRLGGSTRKVR